MNCPAEPCAVKLNMPTMMKSHVLVWHPKVAEMLSPSDWRRLIYHADGDHSGCGVDCPDARAASEQREAQPMR